MNCLPYFSRGEVVRGFGRGSKELGIPTGNDVTSTLTRIAITQDVCLNANFPDSVVEHLPGDISTGIYYGWACVGSGDIHKMVMSIGWNPYYKNSKKSMETHVIHTFKEDFYGQILSVVMVGYIRPERSYDSLDALIAAINNDIEEAKRNLELPEHLKLKEDNFFRATASTSMTTSNKIMNGH
ncbi:riboflavin kinase isoform X2 [Salvelinus alpinus]|uniref:riboflavin kinase isoform X2 n=1 Tax=Salvelinus alpinus TaxID=8036 RepID=UPI0039FDD6E3